MSEETTQAVTPDTQAAEGQQTEPEQPKGQDTTWTLEAALAKIKELNSENAKHRKEKTAAEKAKAEAEANALAEQGRYKELFEKSQPKLNEYDTLKEKYDALIAAVQETNARRIAAIPEAMRTLVPEYDDPLKVAAWLEANAAVFAKPPAPSLDGRAGGGSSAGVTVTDDEVKSFAVRMGIDPQYVDRAALAKMKR